jgi:hypothetical protein
MTEDSRSLVAVNDKLADTDKADVENLINEFFPELPVKSIQAAAFGSHI